MEKEKEIFLSNLSWPKIKNLIEKSTPVIIPVGSNEQHSTHLPVGTDYFLALEGAKEIASKINAVISPVISVGCSDIHRGFSGTISIKTETLAQILYEACECLCKQGFKKIVIFNAHAGNDVAISIAVQRAKQNLEIDIIGILIDDIFKSYPEGYLAKLDVHAGVVETSYMLFTHPDLVDMDKAVKPKITFSPHIENLAKRLSREPFLIKIIMKLFPRRVEQFSDTGAITLDNPAYATVEIGKIFHDKLTNDTVAFLKNWIGEEH